MKLRYIYSDLNAKIITLMLRVDCRNRSLVGHGDYEVQRVQHTAFLSRSPISLNARHGRIQEGGGTGGRLPLFEPREFFETLIVTECVF